MFGTNQTVREDNRSDDSNLPEIIQKLNRSGADMLFIDISCPLKEETMEEYGKELVQGVGGRFDMVAGRTQRVPGWMQNLGMEWLYLFLQGPSRLGKRYLLANTYFAWRLFKELAQTVLTRSTN